jgi:hypothetical protein
MPDCRLSEFISLIRTARCLFAGTDHEDNDQSVPVGQSSQGNAKTTGATVDNSREIC